MAFNSLSPRKILRSGIGALLNLMPLTVWKRFYPKDVITLCYHTVSNQDLPHIKYYRYKNVRQFEADLSYIQDHQRFINYDEVGHHRLKTATLPPNGFFLTFDDGLAECFNVIRPTLLQYGVRGAFFVTTSLIGNRMLFLENKISLCIGAVERLSGEQASELITVLSVAKILQDPNRSEDFNIGMARFRRARIQPPATENHRWLIVSLLMLQPQDAEIVDKYCEHLGINQAEYLGQNPVYLTSEQIRQLAAEGFTVGAHGVSHIKLRLLSSQQQIESEIVTSCDSIRQVTGQKKVPFAFPYTGNGLEVTFLADLVRRYEFIELFFDLRGLHRSPPLIVNRLWVDLPDDRGGEKTNLPRQLSEAWSQAEIWSRRG